MKTNKNIKWVVTVIFFRCICLHFFLIPALCQASQDFQKAPRKFVYSSGRDLKIEAYVTMLYSAPLLYKAAKYCYYKRQCKIKKYRLQLTLKSAENENQFQSKLNTAVLGGRLLEPSGDPSVSLRGAYQEQRGKNADGMHQIALYINSFLADPPSEYLVKLKNETIVTEYQKNLESLRSPKNIKLPGPFNLLPYLPDTWGQVYLTDQNQPHNIIAMEITPFNLVKGLFITAMLSAPLIPTLPLPPKFLSTAITIIATPLAIFFSLRSTEFALKKLYMKYLLPNANEQIIQQHRSRINHLYFGKLTYMYIYGLALTCFLFHGIRYGAERILFHYGR